MTLFTPITSILMICVFSSLMFIGIRKSMLHELNLCIEESTKIQRKHRVLTKELLALNSKVRFWRRARKAAEIANAVAVIPQAKIAAKAALKGVKFIQGGLRAYQTKNIALAYAHSAETNLKMFNHGFIPYKPPTSLKVKKTHAKTDGPEYILQEKYTSKKKIKFFKRYSLFKNTPKKILNFLGVKDVYKNLYCGSTILEKEEGPWKIKLIVDK